MPVDLFLTTEEVSERYRREVSPGTLRNWRAMKIGPSFLKVGKAVLDHDILQGMNGLVVRSKTSARLVWIGFC